jgi:hypothetical protein
LGAAVALPVAKINLVLLLHYADAIAGITPAAPPLWQGAVSGGENEDDGVLEGEVLPNASGTTGAGEDTKDEYTPNPSWCVPFSAQ